MAAVAMEEEAAAVVVGIDPLCRRLALRACRYQEFATAIMANLRVPSPVACLGASYSEGVASLALSREACADVSSFV